MENGNVFGGLHSGDHTGIDNLTYTPWCILALAHQVISHSNPTRHHYQKCDNNHPACETSHMIKLQYRYQSKYKN
jgi:hypothetical protein